MSKEAAYMIYCIERYRQTKGLSGCEVMALFKRYGVMRYLQEFFTILHLQADCLMIAEIDSLLAHRK